MKNTIKCCYECNEHRPGCHALCKKYQRERKLYEDEKEKIRKGRTESMDLFGHLKNWR